VLNRAQTPDQPDWRTLSLQGAVLDQMGRHDEARGYYATALRIAPDEPSVLSNLGLSYALSKDLVRAESTLRRATAHGRADTGVQQNLAVVVALQGRLPEAETTARAHLTSGQGPAAMTHLRQRLAQQNGWKPQGPIKSSSYGVQSGCAVKRNGCTTPRTNARIGAVKARSLWPNSLCGHRY
jgi:Flp pilus assembly protein TadD